jgi:small conductance mechanosensitive channel
VKEAVQEATPGDAEAVREAAEEAVAAAAEAQEATDLLEQEVGEAVERTQEAAAVKAKAFDETAAAEEEAEAGGQEAKVVLLETVNRLREERTQLIDNLKAVLTELESKTDKEDSDTLAKIRDYRLYMSSVQGIQVDLKDATTTWIAVKGWLVSEEGGIRWAQNIAQFVGIILIAWFVSKLIGRAVQRALGMTDKVSRLLGEFLVGMVRWVAMAVGVIMALAALEVSVGPLLALVGAAGFIIALAMQDSLSNFASGIMILAFRPFDVGDVVDAGGVSGSVTSMNLVSTTIKTFDNKKMLVPNNKIWRDVITNATGVTTRRVDMEFGIGYDDDIDRAQAILEEVVRAHPMVLADPEPTIRMNTLADSSINFICRPWARTEDYWTVYWDVTKEVKRRFDAAGIGIPYPQRDVHLYLEEHTVKALSGIGARRPASQGPNPQPYELDEQRDAGPEGS